MEIRRSLMAERKTRICLVHDCVVIFSRKLNENSAIAAAKIGKSDSLSALFVSYPRLNPPAAGVSLESDKLGIELSSLTCDEIY